MSTFLMSSYKLVKSFWANVKGSFSFASLCTFLQQHGCNNGYSNLDLCLERKIHKEIYMSNN